MKISFFMWICAIKICGFGFHEEYYFVAKLWKFFKIQSMGRLQSRFYILNMWFLCGSLCTIVAKIWIQYIILSMWQFMELFFEKFMLLTVNYGFLA